MGITYPKEREVKVTEVELNRRAIIALKKQIDRLTDSLNFQNFIDKRNHIAALKIKLRALEGNKDCTVWNKIDWGISLPSGIQ